MKISEIFHSLQGEGALTGVPSVFIRSSGCNLRCGWCDTPYASWSPEGRTMEVGEIVDEVARFPARHVVLTGGEPMIARDLPALAAALREAGYHITIETAGTVAPDGIACDLASLSPKLANSTPLPGSIDPAWIERHERTRRNPDALQKWVEGYDFQLKFVVASGADIPEIESLVADIGLPIPPWRVQLMPEGTQESALESRQEELIALCRQRGFRYCDRLHIRLFGNRRGT
jgi:7-carboxy-7-deazaguanine synthase